MKKDIYQKKKLFNRNLNIKLFKKETELSYKEQGNFYKQLCILYKSGINFIRSLELISQKTKNKYLKNSLESIILEIKNGTTISKAFIFHGKVFDKFGINLLCIGEETGKLEDVLDDLSKFYVEKYKNNKSIRETMAYPKFLMITTFAVSNLIMLNILPSFYLLVEGSDTIPKFTMMVVTLSLFLSESKVLVLIIQLLIVLAIFIGLRSKIFITNRNKIFPLNIIDKKIYIFNLYHCFSLMISAGISTLEALDIAKTIFTYLDMEKLTEKFNENYSLSQSFKELDYGSNITLELLETGEESGNLEEMFGRGYMILKEDFDSKIKKYISMLSPITIGVLGGVILLVALTIMAPVLDIMSVI